MSKIEEMIRELCPEGVPTKPLEEAGHFFSGLSGKSKADFESGNAPFVTYLDIGNNPSLPAELLGSVRVQESERQNKIVMGDLLFTGSSEDREGVGLTSEVEYEPSVPTYLNSFCFGFRPASGLFARGFLKHLMRSDRVRIRVIAASNGVTRINISKKQLAKVEIAIPPLEVQKEIVSILDKFTQLEAELEAELEARRTQYEVTRDRLLDFSSDLEAHPLRAMIWELCPEGVQAMPLGELVKIRNGRDYKHLSPGDVPVYGSGGVMTYVAEASHTGPSVLIPRKGSLGNLFYVDSPFWTVDTIFYTEIGPALLEKYLFYFLKTLDLAGMNLAGGVPSLTQSMLGRIMVPAPHLEVQKEIVSILDKLDALVNDITIGLPAEIAARRKQYEYYRNKLLSFKELDAA